MMLFQSGRGIDPGKLRVRLNPGDRGEFAVIELTDDGASLFIFAPAEADALIAAATEARRLLSPPVITDSERTCLENNPESGLWCYRNGDHGVHRDADGEEWRTDGLVVAEPACSFIREYDGQIYPCVLGDDHAEHQDRLGARWWHGDDDSQAVTHAAPKKAGQ